MTVEFEYLEASALALFQRCLPTAYNYLYQCSRRAEQAQSANIERVGQALHANAVALVQALQPICDAGKAQALATHFVADEPQVALANLDAEGLEKAHNALMLAALVAMGNSPDQQAALDGFVQAMHADGYYATSEYEGE
jgi:hypothetical protein